MTYTEEIVHLTNQINSKLSDLDLPRNIITVNGNNGLISYAQPSYTFHAHDDNETFRYNVNIQSLRVALVMRVFLGGELIIDWKKILKRKGKS